MKKSLVVLLISAVLAPVLSGSASAADITYVSVAGNWHDPTDSVPGSQPGDPVITNGVPTSIVRWGDTTGSQSGYDYTATTPPPLTLPGPAPLFSLGTFTHRNFQVDQPWLTSVLLDVVLVLSIDGVQTGPLTFTFTFNHEETPNNPTPPATCPYPTPPGEGCTDRVTIVSSAQPTTFNVGGIDYTLSMSFLDEDGNPVSEFITRENGTINTSGLVGQFTLPGVPPDAPVLTVTKSGPATMNQGLWGDFVIDVQNIALADAFNVTLLDRLPDGPTGGMCESTPEVLSARVLAADGVTPVPGKGPLVQGADYSLAYDGAACELTFEALSAASVIGPGERLLIAYRARLDAGTENGVTLTNVVGATQWFNGDSSNPGRQQYTRTLSDGTVGTLDHEDAHTVTVDLAEYLFEKTVVNLTTGANPATTASPGDTLRYTLRLTTDQPLDDITVYDELDAMNATPGFAPGTLTLVSYPPGVDTSATDATGGAQGTGVIDIRNLSLAAGGEAQVVFDVTLGAILPGGSIVANQASLSLDGAQFAVSDDPNVGGPADPAVDGDEDPTRVAIVSSAYFDIDKVSAYLGADPAVLLAGDRLRYTITIQNVGTYHATDVRLRDALPVDTTYVAGSTTLNGNPVPDDAGGALPLIAGIDVNAPGDPTPGSLRAGEPDNVATVTFDVIVNPDVASGTVISNQGYVSAVASGVADQPSDDPRTEIVDDPTRDVVGNYPLLYAEKAAALQVDAGSPGIVDPGDYLRYTIRVYNNGNVPATGVRLVDVVPNDTTYVADTLTLNGLPVGQPDNGVFPLEAGVWISSQDLTPPVPGPNEGTLSPGQYATVQFDVRVNDATPRGTLIVNQATVTTAELATLLTDGDGNPATGPEPTVVVVGDAQQLAITKQVTVVGGGAAVAGATLEYVVTVQNIAAVPATGVYVTDNLDDPFPGYLLYVDGSALLNGSTGGVSVAGAVITANYGAQYGDLAPGASFVLRFQAQIAPDLPIGTTVTNTATVTWNTDQTASASVSIDVGGTPGSGVLAGTVWHDADFDDAVDPNERLLDGWTVELRRNGQLVHTALTDAAGAYRIAGVVPNYQTQDVYELTFRAPGAGAGTALLGLADSDFSNALQRIYDIVVQSGSNFTNLNLPIDPDGVVYNSVSRTPLSGATLRLLSAGTDSPLPDTCFEDPNQQGQITRSDGYYKFDLNFADPGCPSGGSYVIEVDAPGAGFEPGYSRIIPPRADASMPPFNVPMCPGSTDDAVLATLDHCEMQASEFAPAANVPAQSPGTAYHVRLVLDDSDIPGSSQLFNNHIPLDPILTGVVTIAKTTPMVNVTRGQMVPYTITVRNAWQVELTGVDVVDRYPVGFKYIEGSARVDGVALEPTVADGQLVWENLTLPPEGEVEIQLLLAPGAAVVEGKYTNRAQAVQSVTNDALSGEATATVRLVPDPTFDCTDVTGKVFDDANRNGFQDDGEVGIGGARLVTPTGLAALTDAHGRFHITCAITPREGRGSNFMLKLDDRTLPSGYRGSTNDFQVKRATRGKALHFSFGASIHRVIGLDIADPVFRPDSVEMRPQWRSRVDLLVEELRKAPSVLRLSYLADVEDPALVERRVKAMTELVTQAWTAADEPYRLAVEHEVFWRMGRPPATDPRLTAGRETQP